MNGLMQNAEDVQLSLHYLINLHFCGKILKYFENDNTPAISPASEGEYETPL